MDFKKYIVASYCVILFGILALAGHFLIGFSIPVYLSIPYIFMFELASVIVFFDLYNWAKMQKTIYLADVQTRKNKLYLKEVERRIKVVHNVRNKNKN